MLVAILSVEGLEDNEVLIVEGVRHLSRINDPRNRAIFEALPKPNIVSIPLSFFSIFLFIIDMFSFTLFLCYFCTGNGMLHRS